MHQAPVKIPKDNKSLIFLYRTIPGRFILKIMTFPGLSELIGRFMDSRASGFLIDGFIKKNDIDLSQYRDEPYPSFNSFFTRHIKKGLRPIDNDPDHLIAPCDGLLSAYHIEDGLIIPIKQSEYSVADLVKDPRVADMYRDGICLVFRLCVDHYHRYCYPADAKKSGNIHIKGVLHTVRPIALRSLPVFCENSREYTLLKSKNFGTILMMEVGAMLVGRICNHHGKGNVKRGQEKGFFKYGGSTVVMLLKNGVADIDRSFFDATDSGYEIPVRLGECIGVK